MTGFTILSLIDILLMPLEPRLSMDEQYPGVPPIFHPDAAVNASPRSGCISTTEDKTKTLTHAL